MTLNEEFMKVLSAEIEEKNLLVLHKCLMEFKNAGMDKNSMIKSLLSVYQVNKKNRKSRC